MDKSLYQRFFEIEDTYWWSMWVRDMTMEWLPAGDRAARMLDLGCGTGVLSRDLRDRGWVVSLDYVEEALQFSRERGLHRLLRSDGHALPFADAAFDVVLAIDTLEHLRDDATAAREMYRVLKPGGRAVINVPALPILWSSHDVINHHFRRYRKAQLRRLLVGAGFGIRKLTYTNFILFPPTLAVRMTRRLIGDSQTPGSDILELPGSVNSLLYALVSGERRLVRHLGLPVGTSLFAVAERA